MSRLAELVRGAGPPISRVNQRIRDAPVTLNRDLLLNLDALLHLRNGFRAAEGVLLVRPSITVGQVRGVEDWNQLTLWRKPYSRSSEILFFAETVLGWQFGLYRDEVVLFDPEEGERYTFAFTLEAWAEKAQAEIDKLGRTALRMWELDNKPLEVHERLQCRRPLRFGGSETDVAVVRDLELMKRFGTLYTNNLDTVSAETAKLEGWWAGPEEEPEPVTVATDADLDEVDQAMLDAIARELEQTESPKAPPPPEPMGAANDEPATDPSTEPTTDPTTGPVVDSGAEPNSDDEPPAA